MWKKQVKTKHLEKTKTIKNLKTCSKNELKLSEFEKIKSKLKRLNYNEKY